MDLIFWIHAKYSTELLTIDIFYELIKMISKWLREAWQIVDNKAKGQITKRVLQEHKACQIFRKTNFVFF